MLCDFGLTQNQAKVYLFTVRLGIASVGKIAKVSKVRREEIYRLLPKLEEMGLTERVLGTPTKIRATPFEDALSILLKREQEKTNKKISELEVKTEKILKNFNVNKMKMIAEEEEDTQFYLITEKSAILRRTAAMIKNTQMEVDIITSRKKLTPFIPIFSELLKKAIKRGVKVRIITEMPEFEDNIPRIIEEQVSPEDSIELRYSETLQSHFMITDNKEARVTTSTEAHLAESPSLWTNNSNLIGLLQKSFEDSWHTSISWSSVKPETESQKLNRFVKQLKPTDHAILVYDSQEAKHDVLFNYVESGLKNGEAAVYVCSDEIATQIRDAMKHFGVDVEKYEKTGALRIIDYNDVYIIKGKFSIPTTLGFWSKFYTEALAKGFKGLRVTGEMACFFEHNLTRELLEYEKALHRTLEIPIIAICAYNADNLTQGDARLNIYNELVKAHGTVLFTGSNKKLERIKTRAG
jgi:sugar-specific transcriptional regulator TrmB